MNNCSLLLEEHSLGAGHRQQASILVTVLSVVLFPTHPVLYAVTSLMCLEARDAQAPMIRFVFATVS